VGIGIALKDQSPQLNTFWRSRPIQPEHCIWCKYVTGLAVLFASIYLPIVFLAVLSERPVDEGVIYPNAIAVPAGQLAIFAAAVAMTCLVRHAVYAAVLSVATVVAAMAFPALLWHKILRRDWIERTAGHLPSEDVFVAIGFFACFAACTILAWLATRNDWGWKSRY
jgi:hypothetical protein